MIEPRVLVFDCETSPVRFWGWRTGKQYVTHEQIVAGDATRILCIAWTWLGSGRIESLQCMPNRSSDDMIATFTKIVESADVVLAHNGDSFDIKHLNTQRLLAKQPPISWPTSEDTLKMFRQKFYLPSYRLDYIAKLLTGSGKSPMNFQDWVNIVERNDRKAMTKLVKYCCRDVSKLAAVVKEALPHLKLRAHRGLIAGGPASTCPACGSARSMSKGRTIRARTVVQRRRCHDCFHSFITPLPR